MQVTETPLRSNLGTGDPQRGPLLPAAVDRPSLRQGAFHHVIAMKNATAPILALALCSCVVVFPPDDGDESSSSSGSTGGTSGSDESSSGETTDATTDASTGEPSSSSEGSSGETTGGESSGGGETTSGGCSAQPRPYGACDLACGEAACDGGRTCVGDPITGEAACADPCESATDCPADVYPEPWATPVCQPASGIVGSWCGIACAEGSCPNVTICTDLGGTDPLCVGEA